MTSVAKHYAKARAQADLVDEIWLFRWAIERSNNELMRRFYK